MYFEDRINPTEVMYFERSHQPDRSTDGAHVLEVVVRKTQKHMIYFPMPPLPCSFAEHYPASIHTFTRCLKAFFPHRFYLRDSVGFECFDGK